MLIESIPGEPLSFHVIPFDNPRLQYTLQVTRSSVIIIIIFDGNLMSNWYIFLFFFFLVFRLSGTKLGAEERMDFANKEGDFGEL